MLPVKEKEKANLQLHREVLEAPRQYPSHNWLIQVRKPEASTRQHVMSMSYYPLDFPRFCHLQKEKL
jgi:hypothetical protein